MPITLSLKYLLVILELTFVLRFLCKDSVTFCSSSEMVVRRTLDDLYFPYPSSQVILKL